MPLTLAQRLQLLEKRRDDLAAWRLAREWAVEGWTFTAPGSPPVPLRLGDPWPQVDQAVTDGPVQFAAEFEVPGTFAGRPVDLELDVGGEGFVQLESSALTGAVTGGLNEYHRAFQVAECAAGGERVRVQVEAVPKGLFGTPNRAPRLLRAHLVAPEEVVQALLLDLAAVLEAARVLGNLQTGHGPQGGAPGDGHAAVPHLLAAAEAALAGLEWPSGTSEYLARIPHGSMGRSHAGGVWDLPPDLPAPQPLPPEVVAGAQRARAALSEYLGRVRALYPPSGRLALSGHAHIDLAWLWPVAETRRKLRRTFHTLLDLMDRDPELLFGQSSAQAFAWLEEDDPALFLRVQARVREGRFEPVGGMWVEPDCQMTGGESLARHLLYGQRYFRQKFGRGSTVAWLPDTFGFSPALPQLLRQAGIDGFFTTKLNWNETTPFPHDLFEWEGLDGSRVRAHSFFNPTGRAYNGLVEPRDLLGTWEQFRGKGLPLWVTGGAEAREPESLFTFGHGDGGGGPASEHLELYARLRDFPALPRLRMSRVDDFFAALPRKGLPLWVGELYLEFHRGVLTSQARLKRLNRQAEARLLEAEALASLAHLSGHAYPAAELETIWKVTLLHQFHDILPGSSIREVNVQAAAELEGAVARAAGVRDAAVRALTGGEGGAGRWAVANPALHGRPLSVLLPGASGPVQDAGGQELPTQPVEGGLLVHAPGCEVPALGLLELRQSELRAGPGAAPTFPVPVQVRETAQGWVLTNALLEVLVGPDGTLHRVHDREAGREVLTGRGNRLVAHFDLPRDFDAWDVAPSVEGEGEEIGGLEALELIEAGPLRTALRVTRRWRGSRFIQTYRLRADSRRLEMHTRAEWHERRTLVKAVFPLNVRAHEAWFETAFGALARPTHRNAPADAARFEVAGHRWADLGESGYGVSLLNDGKYGHSALGGTLALTLLRGPLYPDPTADDGGHEFTYALYPHTGHWAEGGTVREALDLNSPLVALSASAAAAGPVPAGGRVRASGLPVALGSLKKAEEGGALILRLYEPHGARGEAQIEIAGLRRAERVNLLEEATQPLQLTGERLTLDLRPFEVVTLRLHFA